MSETFTRQLQLQRSIERSLDNFKKLGRTNLTPAKVRSRLSALKDLWRQFQDGNTVLLETVPSTIQQSQDYFVERRYESTEERYQCTVDFMSEILEELKPPLQRSPDELWSDILVHIIVQKLDPVTKPWRLKTIDQLEPPSFKDLSAFLACRARALEEIASFPAIKTASGTAPIRRVTVATAATSPDPACPICKARHFFSECQTFVRGSVSQRRELVRKHGRCFNCLSQGHSVRECKSKYSCRNCQARHHTLLHTSQRPEAHEANDSVIVQPSSNVNPSVEVTSMIASSSKAQHTPVLLATARVRVGTPNGRSLEIRALLDQGSEMTFISEHLAQLLRAKRHRLPTSVSAVGGVHAGTYRFAARISLSPLSSGNPSITTNALILNTLTSYSPKRAEGVASLRHLEGVVWADPDPTSLEPIHLIIGAELYGEVMLEGLRKGNPGQPIAQNSIFGWVISGPTTSTLAAQTHLRPCEINSSHAHHIAVHHCVTESSLEEEIKRFWEVKEPPGHPHTAPDDAACENYFLETHSRTATGRYVVRLPFRAGPPIAIGDSRFRAEKQLNTLVRRLHQQPAKFREYRAFLKEYESLGHSRVVSRASNSLAPCVFLPHHPVFRETSSTSRLRVVFNVSSVTSNGSCLNDHLLSGPKLQADLPSVILRWRQFKFVYTADIAKMFRQILVDPRDLNYQRILWRDSLDDAVEEYQLLTVTYGTACAPFLALRVLRQLARDDGSRFPVAASVLLNHIYVDDVLFGHDNARELRDARDQLINLLRLGGFELRKWASNSADLLTDIDANDHGIACSKSLSDSDHVNILGIGWNPKSDAFHIKVSIQDEMPTTKRWQLIYAGIPRLNELHIPRWSGLTANARIELHGFADASNVAYAAVVYARVATATGKIVITLLQGKSRIAPLKTQSIPSLELLGATLLARLIEFVRSVLNLSAAPCVCWSDSTIVLAWLRQHPSRWRTYVANRVAEVQGRLPGVEWRHIATADNPADCASRGLLGGELLSHPLWWQGPSWLTLSSDLWPTDSEELPADAPLETKKH
ncbi:uncharacterized protein LOC116853391 [Odontomachus brunneus]|uniref:uncharacterized protein LOC116853391 n=1 Tax=Odontomachus brunneus TaxID=486640 RepID=UPI0013F24A40|nr:uncharacterized protein LOC116853391 [Odontomachus brunneus]